MVRITTGTAKNKKLKTPVIEGFQAIQEVAKGALFSIIGERVTGAQCLDLFAGSGNLGIEALSRGATWCDFVDKNRDAEKAIADNIKNCGFENVSEFHRKESVKFAGNTEKKYDLIFLDPFYDDISHVFLMTNLEEILNPNGMIAFFHGNNLEIEKVIKDTKLQVVDDRRFGRSFFKILEHGK